MIFNNYLSRKISITFILISVSMIQSALAGSCSFTSAGSSATTPYLCSIPSGATSINVTAVGAGGGVGRNGAFGGSGARVAVTNLTLSTPVTLSVVVGGAGVSSDNGGGGGGSSNVTVGSSANPSIIAAGGGGGGGGGSLPGGNGAAGGTSAGGNGNGAGALGTSPAGAGSGGTGFGGSGGSGGPPGGTGGTGTGGGSGGSDNSGFAGGGGGGGYGGGSDGGIGGSGGAGGSLGITAGGATTVFSPASNAGADGSVTIAWIDSANPIPTLGEYGLIALASLLAMFGIGSMHRRGKI